MTEAENKELFRRYIAVVFNEGRHDLLPDFVFEDAVDHDPVPDAEGLPILEGLTAFLEMRRRAFPDITYTIDEVMAEGERFSASSRSTAPTPAPPAASRPAGHTWR